MTLQYELTPMKNKKKFNELNPMKSFNFIGYKIEQF